MAAETREQSLATNLVMRMKEALDEAVADEDYTRILEISETVIGSDDDEVDELIGLIDDGSFEDDDFELDEEFDDFDEDFNEDDSELEDEEDDEDDPLYEDDDE